MLFGSSSSAVGAGPTRGANLPPSPRLRRTAEAQSAKAGYGSRNAALIASLATHTLLLLLVFLVARLPSKAEPQDAAPDRPPRDIVWLIEPGPGGGGGGGGNRRPEPPKPVERIGQHALTVPVAPAPVTQPVDTQPPEPEPALTIPAAPIASAAITAPGALDSPRASDAISQGSGDDGGAGTGTGTGIGPGQGSGLGSGFGGGTGGGGYRPGNGVSSPTLVRRVTPAYTAAAVRARVQGIVTLECTVLATGTVGNCSVTRSLDSTFGLDDEAIKAARQWQFMPGKRLGEPVPVFVSIELSFQMH